MYKGAKASWRPPRGGRGRGGNGRGMPIRIVKGLDIAIQGAPGPEIEDGPPVTRAALLGGDYVGLSPAMRIREGDRVVLGQPLFADRHHDRVVFTAPAGGIVTEINRGARRALVSVVIGVEGDEAETFPSWPADAVAGLRRDQVADTLLASGLWTALRARPYGRVADPDTAPASIFVTAMDSNPLAADPAAVVAARPEDFANGLAAVARLTDGPVYLCTAPRAALPGAGSGRLTVEEFSGPHPAGLVGTHIHFLDPVGAGRAVWHVGYQDVMAIGRLLTTGRPMGEKIVALGGPPVRRPRLIRTRPGAAIDELVAGGLTADRCRVISGSVLSGRRAAGPTSYLGRYHNQVSVIAEGGGAPAGAYTAYRAGAERPGRRRFGFTTSLHGAPSAMLPLGGYERVMPLDILATPLLRALLVGDTDMAQALGCLELDEEDLALCSLVCPGKQEYGPLLRAALTRIEKEG